ncbi:MAG: NADH:flavin oxidoreductase, partial [Candidatus Marinimicrobia bacterium]|nr:NADH:flavin oxidoreductase [Candidatus Neomarinimicrobiota bacterium]
MNIKSKPSDPYVFPRTKKKIRNRSVLAAMTNKQSHRDGTLSDEEINWLTRRAKDGFGIITTAATHVSKNGQGWEGEFGVYKDSFIDRLKVLTDSIHEYDSLIFAQLFHGGMRAPEKLTGNIPISSSKIPCKESSTGSTKAANQKDIEDIIFDFKSAAIRCVEAGFDGIELHGAHGYLISQFLGKKTNHRKDIWGG